VTEIIHIPGDGALRIFNKRGNIGRESLVGFLLPIVFGVEIGPVMPTGMRNIFAGIGPGQDLVPIESPVALFIGNPMVVFRDGFNKGLFLASLWCDQNFLGYSIVFLFCRLYGNNRNKAQQCGQN
jgi:hypothetical protein